MIVQKSFYNADLEIKKHFLLSKLKTALYFFNNDIIFLINLMHDWWIKVLPSFKKSITYSFKQKVLSSQINQNIKMLYSPFVDQINMWISKNCIDIN